MNKEKCRKYIKSVFRLIKVTKELTDEEIEYINQHFDLTLVDIKMEEMRD